MSILVSIENLLSGNFVEGARMEFKKGWNPTAVMRSVCAFANDFDRGVVKARRYRNRRIGEFLKTLIFLKKRCLNILESVQLQ